MPAAYGEATSVKKLLFWKTRAPSFLQDERDGVAFEYVLIGVQHQRLSAPDKAKLGLHFLLGNHPSFPPTAKTSNFPQKAGFQGQIAEIPQS